MEATWYQLILKFLDSRDDSKMAYILVNNCKVPVVKAKIGDFCYVLKLIGDKCHVSIDMQDCDKEPIK